MSGERPILAQRIIYTALALLAAVVILSLAVSVLQAIWPWLVAIGLVIVIAIGTNWWLKQRRSRW